MTDNLSGKVVAVTGAGRGIGAAIAHELAARGAQVAVGDLDLPRAEEVACTIGAQALALPLDVTEPGSVTAFLDRAESLLGPLDVLVNNAGVMPLATLLEEEDGVTSALLDLNVRALITTTRAAARRMAPRGRGHLVNIASTAGKVGLPGGATYCATKAAVIAFTEAIAQELAPLGLHASVVLPGIVRTELATGVPDVPGLRAIAPDQVARAVADVLAKPRLEVYVPASAGPLVRVGALLPRRAGLRLAHWLKADTVFTDALADPERASYEERVARDSTHRGLSRSSGAGF